MSIDIQNKRAILLNHQKDGQVTFLPSLISRFFLQRLLRIALTNPLTQFQYIVKMIIKGLAVHFTLFRNLLHRNFVQCLLRKQFFKCKGNRHFGRRFAHRLSSKRDALALLVPSHYFRPSMMQYSIDDLLLSTCTKSLSESWSSTGCVFLKITLSLDCARSRRTLAHPSATDSSLSESWSSTGCVFLKKNLSLDCARSCRTLAHPSSPDSSLSESWSSTGCVFLKKNASP